MKKRLVALVVGAAMITTGLLLGCTGNDTTPAGDDVVVEEPAETPVEEPAEEPAIVGEEVVINFFHMTWVPEMLEVVEETIAVFEAENPGIRVVETRVSWTDAPSQLMASIMGGSPPDIVMANPSILAQFRGLGAFADLTDRIDPAFVDGLFPTAVQIMTNPYGRFDGKPQEGANWALFYRKDLFEEAGLDPNRPPTNWEELVEMAEALTVDTNGDGVVDQFGFGWPVAAENATDYWVNFMQMAGSPITEFVDGNWVSRLDGPEALQATQFMVDLVQEYGVSPASIVGWDWEGVTNAFVSGDVAMMHNGGWVVGVVQERGPELEGQWGTAWLPAGPAGYAFRGHPNTFHILEASNHQDEAWAFLEFFYNAPSQIPGLTFMDAFCAAPGGMMYTHDFLEWAIENYDPLLTPFLEAAEYAVIPPMDPQWMNLSNMYVQSTVQEMLMGTVSVEDGLARLHAALLDMQAQ
ncbi:MAG: sugar ABC transporter substrate-binding protein [Lachnospiraceae bacterium]|nr:sugar ABC transporter substrate-binding protein [Lachnospiraceae bacterium]